MVYRSISTTHLNSNDINNVLPIPTINYKSSSFSNLTLPPPQNTDYDPGKQARRSVRRLSIDIERLRLKKDVTTLCTTKRRNSVCRSVGDLSKSGLLYDDLKSLKTRRNECVQKQKSDKIAVPCTTTTTLTIPPFTDKPSNSSTNPPSWLSEGLEPEPELEEKNVNSIQCSLPLNRLPVKVVDLLLSMKSNNANDKLKILCLYCDRTFSSHSLYAKHSERVHQAPEGRRLSARKSNSSSLLYPGCSHCNNGKTTSLLNDELPALFDHLIDIHFDKYFACKPCTIRFPSKETLEVHLDQLHKDSKSKISTNGTHEKRKKRCERRDKLSIPDDEFTDISQPLSIQVDLDESYDDKKDEDKSSSDEPILRSSRRQHANRLELMKTSNPRKTRMLRNEETILSRLGITQNRSPRTRRGLKARTEVTRAETPIIRPIRNKNTRSTNNSSGAMVEGIEMSTRSSGITKVESLSSTFDENFYESVNSNVRQNLSCHLDGKLQSGPMSPSPISPVDPVPTVRSTLVKSPLVADSEIHEATAISALTAFPTLLTASQYGAEPMPVGKIKKPITKNSWKWKWDCVKKYKYVNEGGKVVKKVKQPVAGIRDLSKLDMWTQLTMRTKHELVRKQEIEISGEEPCLAIGEAVREDKRKLIERLNSILDARVLPQINLEQNDQRVVKLEVIESQFDAEHQSTEMKPETDDATDDLPTMLQLKRRPVITFGNEEEKVLSGEWARPRCYICYGCGEKFENIRRLEDHKSTYHPHVYSTHYEIVGKELIEGDLFRHFYIPTAALRRHNKQLQRLNSNLQRKNNVEVEDSMDSVTSFSASCSKSDSFDTDSNSRNSKVSATSISSSVGSSIDESSINEVAGVLKKSCTKCKRSYNTMYDLYRHMLDCSGDYDWFLAKKRHNIKYRYFGSRRRKINRHNFGNRRPIRPKKEGSETPKVRDTQTPKPRPSDAESIQRMLANLPAKRVCRQIFPNLQAKKRVRKFMPVNTLGRNRQQIHMKQTKNKTNRNFKFISTTQTTVTAIRKNITRRLRFFSTNTCDMTRSTRSAKSSDDKTPKVVNDATSPKCRGVVKNITRRAQRVFPKLSNSFRRPLQKHNLRNAANGSPKAVAKETKSSSILERMNFRKSKRVQVTLKKLEENIVDLAKLDDKTNVDNIEKHEDGTDNVKMKKAPLKKRTIKRIIKGFRGKRTGKKNSNAKDDIELEEPNVTMENEDDDANQIDEVKETQAFQIDESSQSSNRSSSSKRSKQDSIKKQKPPDTNDVEANPKESDMDTASSIETSTLTLENNIQVSNVDQDVVKTCIISEEPMDLSQSKSLLSIPIVQESVKTPPTKRRTRKLNDCIAMLTGKLQEKLGVPFLDSETSILLSPTISNVSIREESSATEVLMISQSVTEIKSVEPEKLRTPTKEISSNHSTPTKRGNRKGRSINFENESPKLNEIEAPNNITIETTDVNVANYTQSNNTDDTILESIQLHDSGVEVTTPIKHPCDSDSNTKINISNESTDIIVESPPINDLSAIPSSNESMELENVSSLEATPKRGSKIPISKPVELDELSSTNKNVGNDIPIVTDEPTTELIEATKAVKRKESKKKFLIETIVTLDTTELVEMESSSIEHQVPRRRQKKILTSTQSSVVTVKEAESAVLSTPADLTEELSEVTSESLKTPKRRQKKILTSTQSSVVTVKEAESAVLSTPADLTEELSEVTSESPKTPKRRQKKNLTSTQSSVVTVKEAESAVLSTPSDLTEELSEVTPELTKTPKRRQKKNLTSTQSSVVTVKEAESDVLPTPSDLTEELSEVTPESPKTPKRRQKKNLTSTQSSVVTVKEAEYDVLPTPSDLTEVLSKVTPASPKTPKGRQKKNSASTQSSVVTVKEAESSVLSTPSDVTEELSEVTPESSKTPKGRQKKNSASTQSSVVTVKETESTVLSTPSDLTEELSEVTPESSKTPKGRQKKNSASTQSSVVTVKEAESNVLPTPSDFTEELSEVTPESPKTPKKRQKKNSASTQSSVVTVKEAESTVLSTPSDVTEEINEITTESPKTTAKLKRGKGSINKGKPNKVAKKYARKNISKGATLPSPQIEQTENGTTLVEDDEKSVEIVEDEKKIRKLSKTSKVSKVCDFTSTLSDDVVNSSKTNFDLSDDDEMHPWDPEVGFVTPKNLESKYTSVNESTAAPDEPTNIEELVSPFKTPAIQTTSFEKTNDTKSAIKKKRRKNELAKIIADQLLESFKEVDKSRIEELKLLHDLSIESNDDLLITTTLSRTPPPKRRTVANIRTDALVDLDTSFEATNSSDDLESGGKTTTAKRKRASIVEAKKVVQNVKLVTKRKMVGQKGNKKESKKKVNDIGNAGYLSDSEICHAKEPVIMRRRLTICDESPKRMSRNSKETEVSISLFDSIRKPRNVSDITTKQAPIEPKLKVQTKVRKRKNRRNVLSQPIDDHSASEPVEENMIQNNVDEQSSMSILSDKNGKEKAAVNDLVAQIINDFTTSTLNSPTTSPIVFGEITKPTIGLNNAATKLSNVLSNKKNILNGEVLSNGFKNDVSKEITFATLSQPLKNKTIEHIRNTDIALDTNAKAPLRAPFMSPRWEQTDEWNASAKVSEISVKDQAMHKLWTLNNKDEKLSSEKSLYQSVKDKTKKLFGKISKKKLRKHDGALLNNKTTTTVMGIKRPLLRPSILSVSNVTTIVDIVESENCLKKLESNSLFLGKVSNFENDSISKIFLNEKTISVATDKNKISELSAENELFGRKNDVPTSVLDNLKSNIEKDVGSKSKIEKQQRKNAKKGKGAKNNKKSPLPTMTDEEAVIQSRSSKKQTNEEENETTAQTDIIIDEVKCTNEMIDITMVAVDAEDVVKTVKVNIEKTKTMKRRKMGSIKRRTNIAILTEKLPDTTSASDSLNTAFCESEDSPAKPTKNNTTVRKKPIVTKSFDPCCESSQDTIISEIVNKIRDANNDQTTESDEDLSLAEIAKNLNNKILNCDEFSNDGIAMPLELSESFVDENNFNFNTSVSELHEQMEPKIDEGNQQSVTCDDKPTKAYTDVDDSEFLNENTNTDLIDMDLEDTASVYTSSMETTVTNSGGSQKKQRKRRHGRSILMKSNRKSKRSDGDFLTPGESYFCDICSKTFRTQGGLATHRTTLTHISKLSEQEFKLRMEPSKDIIPEPKVTIEEDAATKPDITKSPIIESSSQPLIPLSQSPPSVQRHQPITSPIRNQSMTYLNNIEPISSPEQHDLNYDRYNNTTPRSRNPTMHESSRLALSQEQRFFYECCSMLKGSDRSNINPSDSPNKYYTLPQRSEVITKPVTPRSNEQYSYVVPEGSKHSKGIPKIDLNQFSDISSDSNPAYSCPQNPSSSETQNIFPIESKLITEKDYHSLATNNYDFMKKDAQTFDARTTVIDPEYLETFSDMGDSFPSSQDVSESEQYVQTILERSSNPIGIREGAYHDNYSATYSKNAEDDKKRTNLLTMATEGHEAKGFSNGSPIESPLHSTSSQSSVLSKPRTKAAMKGYDNFKVSIPTTGLDLQQALNRSPNPSGCKLAALADIALGNDVPNAVGLVRSTSIIDLEPCQTVSVYQTPEPQTPEPPVLEVTPTVKPQITNKSIGNKLGFNHRKKKIVSPKTTKKSNKLSVKSPPNSLTKTQPKDVYDFEDFDDSTDAPILTLSQVRSKPIPSTNADDVDSEISSYSDREDYNYESMSESDTSVNNLQKKCLIEHIFKSVKKTDVREKDKVEPKKPLPKQELDKLFDGLRHSEKTVKVEEKKTEEVTGAHKEKTGTNKEKTERSKNRQSKKPREIANLEEEWGMSMNEIVELIGVGQRKTQRRCAVNKQKTFAENWSSDEYEDFHATKDIFALIHEAEMKAGRARSRTARSNAKRENQQDIGEGDKNQDATKQTNSTISVANKGSTKDKENKSSLEDKKDTKVDDSEELVHVTKSEPSKKLHSKSTDSKTSSKKPAKVKKSKSFVEMDSEDSEEEFGVKKVSHSTKAPKIKNRRQTISSRHEMHKSTSKAITNGARVKQNRSVDSRDIKSDSKSKLKPMPRRKRKASEMLYYWSSSSDEEFGRIKPRDDNFDDDNLEQHGWIVGDSHKKLVTLLAHAKGKKIEDCAVKEAIHKKKS